MRRRRSGHDRRRRYKITVSCKQRISSARLMAAWVAVAPVPELHVFSASAEAAAATTGRRSVRANERVSLRDNSSDKRSSETVVFIVPVASLDLASEIICHD